MRQDAGQVGSVYPTFPLCSVPGPTVCKVPVAVRLKLLPTKTTHLNVLFTELSFVAREAETGEGVDPIQASGSIQTRVRLALINICFTVPPGVSRCTDADILWSFLVARASVLTHIG